MQRAVKHPILLCAVLIGLFVAVAPASAGHILDPRIECGGDFAAGDTVPFTISLENRGDEAARLEAQVTLTVPGIGQIAIVGGVFTLAAGGEYLNTERSVSLPQRAPLGEYALTFTVTSEEEATFESCDFEVR